MTKRDYEALAAILRQALADAWTVSDRRKVKSIGLAQADYFERTYPRFDRDRFFTAAGFDE